MAKQSLKEKLNSSTLILSIWSMLIITLIIIFKLEVFVGLSMALVSIPLGYVAGNKINNYKYGLQNTVETGIKVKEKPIDETQ
jgi:hypothetical protein